MKTNGVIQRKLALLDKHLLNLRNEFKGVSLEDFRESWVLQRMAERVLQVMIEICIDVAERIIALKGAGPAATGSEAIEKLAALGAIQSAQPYVEMVHFRNLVVHQYEEIDPEILYSIVSKKLDDFRRFRDEIDKL
ncbi:MAG: DUF86 domain-containing protein [Planctomycetes bacterium]|nr:DUF86 domain-containing protein [Planctomycetota bacterium]